MSVQYDPSAVMSSRDSAAMTSIVSKSITRIVCRSPDQVDEPIGFTFATAYSVTLKPLPAALVTLMSRRVPRCPSCAREAERGRERQREAERGRERQREADNDLSD